MTESSTSLASYIFLVKYGSSVRSLTSQVRDRHFFHPGLSLNHCGEGEIGAAATASSVHSS